MQTYLRKVEEEEKPIIRQLLELYCYDFSEYLNTDVESDGKFHYKYLDHYWEEENRHAFFITVKEKLAGFVLINKDLKLLKEGHCVAEFFVLRKYRKQGIGSKAAVLTFNLFKGPWEVSVITVNQPATKFWQKVINRYTSQNYRSRIMEYRSREKLFFTFNA